MGFFDEAIEAEKEAQQAALDARTAEREASQQQAEALLTDFVSTLRSRGVPLDSLSFGERRKVQVKQQKGLFSRAVITEERRWQPAGTLTGWKLFDPTSADNPGRGVQPSEAIDGVFITEDAQYFTFWDYPSATQVNRRLHWIYPSDVAHLKDTLLRYAKKLA